MNASVVVDEICRTILAIKMDSPLRVAIDGRTASGKSTLAAALSQALRASGRVVINGTVDGFHRPKAVRYRRGRYSAEGYYYDARDLNSVRQQLLDPLGPGGNRLYRLGSFDLETDTPIDLPLSLAPVDAILLLDGSFLQRGELRSALDLVIYVHARVEEANARGIERDKRRYDANTDVEKLYAARYNPAFELYESECSPALSADIVIDNSDLLVPILLRNAAGPRSRLLEAEVDPLANVRGSN